MAAPIKKRVIKSLENLSDDLRELIHEQYPNGYESSINRIMNAKKEPIFVFPLETADSVYLIKVPVSKNSDGGYNVELDEDDDFNPSDENLKSTDDDDFDNDSGKESAYGPDFDNDGGKESAYDPDFDN